MFDAEAVSGPADEQVVGIPFHPPTEYPVPSRPCAGHVGSGSWINELATNRLPAVARTIQLHHIDGAVSRLKVHVDQMIFAFEQCPEALLDAMLEFFRLQVPLELIVGLLSSHWVQAQAWRAKRSCIHAMRRSVSSRSAPGQLGNLQRVPGPGT